MWAPLKALSLHNGIQMVPRDCSVATDVSCQTIKLMVLLSDMKEALQKQIYDLRESIISLREKHSNALLTEEVPRKDNLIKSYTGEKYNVYYCYNYTTLYIIHDYRVVGCLPGFG